MISSTNVQDPDNAKMYYRAETGFNFVTDFSGATGIQGPRGPQGPQGPKGDTGPQGPAGTNLVLHSGSGSLEYVPVVLFDKPIYNVYYLRTQDGDPIQDDVILCRNEDDSGAGHLYGYRVTENGLVKLDTENDVVYFNYLDVK
jgi:hypothetical protein